MTRAPATGLRTLIDGEAFVRHGRSGITRYFSELLREFRADPGLGVAPSTPYRYVANDHLTDTDPERYRRILLPPRARPRVLGALNHRARRRSSGDVDLVHHTLYLPERLGLLGRVPQVCTVYDFTLELYPDLFPGWLPLLDDKQRFLEECDGLLCISQTTYDDLRRRHPDLDKPVEITPLGVGEAFFAPRGPRPDGVPDRYVLFVGNRHANKNVGVLFRAFAELTDADPTIELVLCGNRLTDAEGEELEALGIAHRVRSLRAGDDELPALYAHASAFVFPSRYEGFGLPVAEAMAAGTPVLVADVPALVEVSDGAALVFDPDDHLQLAGLLEELLGDPARQAELSATGALRARDLSWRRTAVTTAAAYARIVRA